MGCAAGVQKGTSVSRLGIRCTNHVFIIFVQSIGDAIIFTSRLSQLLEMQLPREERILTIWGYGAHEVKEAILSFYYVVFIDTRWCRSRRY